MVWKSWVGWWVRARVIRRRHLRRLRICLQLFSSMKLIQLLPSVKRSVQVHIFITTWCWAYVTDQWRSQVLCCLITSYMYEQYEGSFKCCGQGGYKLTQLHWSSSEAVWLISLWSWHWYLWSHWLSKDPSYSHQEHEVGWRCQPWAGEPCLIHLIFDHIQQWIILDHC